MVVLSTLKEAYREDEGTVAAVEVTREPAKDKAAEEKDSEEETAAGDIKVEIAKSPKEAWKKPTDKLYWLKAIGKIP